MIKKQPNYWDKQHLVSALKNTTQGLHRRLFLKNAKIVVKYLGILKVNAQYSLNQYSAFTM